MRKNELIKDEKLEMILSPHPLSFIGYQSLSLFLIIWGIVLGWLVNFSDMKKYFSSDFIIIFLWAIVLLLTGIIASLISVRWRIFFFYLLGISGGIGLMIWQNWFDGAELFLPIYTIAISIVGFLLIELFRRSHKYIISNKRIIFKGGIITKEERTLRYDKITDINAKQGILGQIFGFGTIIPISQSGFGLGTDNSFAGGGAQFGEKKVKLFGLFGGGKGIQTPRARSYYELHGIYPYKEIKKLIEELVQITDLTQYQKDQVAFQKEQVDIQKQMRDLLSQGNKKINFQEDPVNSSEEHDDIQNQMRELLKMQANQREDKIEKNENIDEVVNKRETNDEENQENDNM